MYATTYFENMILNTMRGTTATAPANRYIGLYFNNPDESGTSGVEVAYTGYARQAITFTAPATMSGGRGIQNSADITFPVCPVALAAITYVGISDALTGGNMLLYGPYTEPLAVEPQESPVIVAGEVQWWMTGDFTTACKDRVLNILRATNLAGATTYISLWDGDPDAGGVELTGGGYARQAVTLQAPTKAANGMSYTTNPAQVTFPRATAAWGTWAYTTLMTAATGGNSVVKIQRSTSKVIRKGVRPIYVAQGINIYIN